MPTPFQVRRARTGDHVAVADLTAGVYLDEGWADEDYALTLRDVARRDAEAEVWVAVTPGGELLGAVTVATRGGPLAERARPAEAVVRHLVTAPAARGGGVGQALVAACLDRAREAGCRVVRLSTQPQMASAHRLYERFGFVRTPEDDWTPQPGVDLLTYALVLPSFCDQCGEPVPGGAAAAHARCQAQRALDPPRWCPLCRRRMVVQVTPAGWSARCVEHGTTTRVTG